MSYRAGLSALGCGLLWPIFDPGRLRLLFVDRLPTLEQWPVWRKQRVVARTRQIGEQFEPGESWIPNSLS